MRSRQRWNASLDRAAGRRAEGEKKAGRVAQSAEGWWGTRREVNMSGRYLFYSNQRERTNGHPNWEERAKSAEPASAKERATLDHPRSKSHPLSTRLSSVPYLISKTPRTSPYFI